MVRVVFSNRRTMCLQVLDSGEVVARVPHGTSQASVDALVASHKSWLNKAQLRAQERRAKTVRLSSEDVADLKKKAREALVPRVFELAERLGVQPTRVTIRNQKTRWGSCSAKGAISLNCQLMLLDDELRDYVIIHELCHLVHFNHSARFWSLVQRYVPDAPALRRALKERNIQPLEQ